MHYRVVVVQYICEPNAWQLVLAVVGVGLGGEGGKAINADSAAWRRAASVSRRSISRASSHLRRPSNLTDSKLTL